MIRLTRAQLREIDRLSIERYLIPGIVLMENASRCAADIACQMLGHVSGAPVLILCGPGNNGGDGLAIARHLHNRGADVYIEHLTKPEHYRRDALTNFNICREMGLKISPVNVKAIRAYTARLVVDAMWGTGLNRAPQEPFGWVVSAVKQSRVPVLAVDIPSGLNCDSGKPLGMCIEATRTITFVTEKIGFVNPLAAKYIGQVTIGDIGCPRELIDEVARMI